MKLLKRNNWLREDSICVAQGSSVALNLMFESKKEHELFFTLWEKYLGEMVDIIQYYLSPTSWTILFQTKSRHEIQRAYLMQRNKSKKAKLECTLQDPSKILSEHMRIFLSQFVRQSNQVLGRNGSKVMHRFKKCVLNKYENYHDIFQKLTNQVRNALQQRACYRANEKTYDQSSEMNNESVWKVGNIYYQTNLTNEDRDVRERDGEFKMECKMRADEVKKVDGVVRGIKLILPSHPVLRKYLKYIENPKIKHPPNK